MKGRLRAAVRLFARKVGQTLKPTDCIICYYSRLFGAGFIAVWIAGFISVLPTILLTLILFLFLVKVLLRWIDSNEMDFES